MIFAEYRLPLMDFRDEAHKIPNLVSIVVFGSLVRDELSPKSDIDLLLVFDTDHNPELGEEAKIAHEVAMKISIKYDLIHPFSLIFINQQTIEDTEPDFLWNVAREGILLWESLLMLFIGNHLLHWSPFYWSNTRPEIWSLKRRESFFVNYTQPKRG